MKRQPERTCIGCRGTFKKEEVVRIIAAPTGAVIDYREKLPGRAAYICPNKKCINKALVKDGLSRAFRTKVPTPAADGFVVTLAGCIREKIKSLIAMSAKAGKLMAGYSGVQDGLEKGRVEMLLYAEDFSEASRERVEKVRITAIRETTLFSREELGKLLNREFVGVVAILDKKLADATWKETERLKNLINDNE